jgi:hypothetical protein
MAFSVPDESIDYWVDDTLHQVCSKP